ncbi:hypothetical protein MHYP_G00013280 [Metynnis hypsauchen]
MASTERSAVDYIRNGRAALVRGLRNLPLIARTVRERGLLPDPEIELIFNQGAAPADQVRQLLDAAAEKGEDVCYELLRVFDDTRDQTFGEHPELYQWISCFSFGHDPQHQSDDMADSGPCAKYQKQLKTRAMQILHEKWMQSMTFLKYKAKEKSFRYIPLVLDTDASAVHHTKIKVYKKTRTKKLKKSIPTDRRKLSPYQLLTSNERKILLVGKPGIGKTTVVQEILRMWADGEDSQVSYMFFFDEPLIKLMSKSEENESLSSFLFNKYLMPVESPDIVWKDVEDNSENVVIIFDGFMDIVSDSVIESILKKEILNDAKVLITCRPEADVAGDLSDWASFRVEVQGFSESSIRAYFKLMLGINDDTNIPVLNNLELFSLCHVPMYAFIVTACILFSPSEADNQPCTITEMYVRIFRYCIALHRENIDNLDKYIQEKMNNILFLASTSYQAILSKTVNLADVCLKDTVQHAFLTPVTFDRTSMFCQTAFVFLHNTMQEFWAALFLLMTPYKIGHLLKQSQTEEGKYLKYVITFLCGLLSEKMGTYLKCLVSHDQVKSISAKYFKDIMNTFLYSVEEDEPEPYVEPENVLYVCQCLYEYQAPEACLLILKKIDNRVDLNEQSLDPHQCCAVSYVISQSTAQTVQLDLTNCAISDPGVKLILGSMTNLKSLSLSSGPMQCQMWRVALQESSTDFDNLLRLFGFEMHLSVQEQQKSKMFENTKAVLTAKRQNKVKLCLHMDTQQIAAKSLLENIYGSLHNIADLRVISTGRSSEVLSFQMDLFLQGALYETETGQTLSTLCITSELQATKKPVELRGWTNNEKDLKCFLQCLCFVSQLRFSDLGLILNDDIRGAVKLLVHLFISASESGGETLNILSSVCSYSTFPFADDTGEVQSTFLLELYSYVRELESQTGRSVLPALKPIYQSAPATWVIHLSKGVTPLLCETMQVQATKRPVEIRGLTTDESELRTILHCVPYMLELKCSGRFFQSVCEVLSTGQNWNPVEVATLLRPLNFTVTLMEMLPRRICSAVGRVLSQADPKERLCLSLIPQSISWQGMNALFLAISNLQKLRLSDRNVQQIAEIVYETQDDHVTRFFLEKIGGDLTSSSMPWNILHYLLQKANLPLMVDPKKNRFGTLNIQHLLPLLQSIRFNGTDSQFVRNALNEIYASRAGHFVTNLVKSSDNWINLSEQELESYDCAALRFALHYSDDVKLNLLGTVIPKEETENILQLLHRVSELRVHRHLLLNLLHACSVSREQKKVTTSLLMALHKKLDFSQSSTVNLFGPESRKTLTLSDMDCRSISSAIQLSACDTELIMFDCEASDGTLLELFPALHHIHLSLGKPELLRLMLLTQDVEEARALARSLGKEMDLSHTTLNSCACEVLGLILEHSEHLRHLNLCHCKLTDSCLNLLLPHLHKVQELDLSNNDITDAGAQKLQNILVRTQTVHIFNNHITDIRFFMNNQYNPVVSIEIDHNWPAEKGDHSKFLVTDDFEPVFMMKPSIGILTKKITTVTLFDPEISVHDDVVGYRFECEMGGRVPVQSNRAWEIYLLHLPHCEADADALGDISVAHMHDGVTEILTPVQMTATHVTVCISGLSAFRIVRRKGCMTRYVRSQVLLFLDQISRVEQRLWVFLLARNVSATEIKKEHQELTPIKTSSDCILRQKGKYCLSSSLKKYKVQPKTYDFHDASDPDHHSAFELFFGSEVSELRVRLHEKRSPKREITKWNRRVILKCNDNRAYKIKTEGGTNGKGNSLLTEKKWRSSLSDLLDELHEDELKKMKAYMRHYIDFAPIPKGKLEKKERHELVDLIVETWGFQPSIQAVACIMRKLPRNDYAVISILKPYQIQFGLITDQENTDF